MEVLTINCPNCDNEIKVRLNEFIDVSADPIYKQKILNGEFFIQTCPECKDETLVEYPTMYIDSDKKLTVYMAPDHDESFLEQLNSLEVPAGDIDAEAAFRVVENSAQLVEKILLRDNGRDDKVMELYKAIVCDDMRTDFPDIQTGDLLYLNDAGEEMLVVWPSEKDDGAFLTVEVNAEMFEELEEKYGEYLETEPNKYIEINENWIMERVEIED